MSGLFRRSAAAFTLVLPLLTACSASRTESGLALRHGTTSPPGPRMSLSLTQTAQNQGVDVDVQVDEPAHVLAVAVDYEGAVRVLYPADPANVALVAPLGTKRLAHFFPRLGIASLKGELLTYRISGAQPGTMRLGKREGVAAVIVVASTRPLALDGIKQDGDFSVSAIEDVLYGNTIATGTERLAQLVTAPGQRLSVEYRIIAGPRARAYSYHSRHPQTNPQCLPSATATPYQPSSDCVLSFRLGRLGVAPQ